jgi:plastocyanin
LFRLFLEGFMKTPSRFASLVCLIMLTAACGSDPGTTPPDDSEGGPAEGSIVVTAADFSFDPSTVSVDAGESIEITLENSGERDHTFTSNELGIDIRAASGESASATLDAPEEDATFEFFCAIHPAQMQGEVIVGAGGAGTGGPGDETGEGSEENDDGSDY